MPGASRLGMNFKSLASTRSATSALLISIAFSFQAGKCFPIEPLRFHFGYKTRSRLVLTVFDPAECSDDVLLGLDVPGIVGAHAFRLVADQIGHLAGVGAVAPPPSSVGHAQDRAAWCRRQCGRRAPGRAASGSPGSASPSRTATPSRRRGQRSACSPAAPSARP